MKNIIDLLDIGAKKHLRVRPDKVHGVYDIQLTQLPWNQSKAHEERQELLLLLCQEFPNCALWLTDWCADQVAAWQFPTQSELQSTIEHLYEGAWGLFFFETPQSSLPALAHLPADETHLKTLLTELGAVAAILSWYDDNEWTIALGTSSCANTNDRGI